MNIFAYFTNLVRLLNENLAPSIHIIVVSLYIYYCSFILTVIREDVYTKYFFMKMD